MAKRKDYTVTSKRVVFGKAKTKAGKSAKIGTEVTYKDGSTQVLLTPSGKGVKYAAELKNGVRYTNAGQKKCDSDGVVLGLTKAQRAYRAGYLAHSKDSSRAYNAKCK